MREREREKWFESRARDLSVTHFKYYISLGEMHNLILSFFFLFFFFVLYFLLNFVWKSWVLNSNLVELFKCLPNTFVSSLEQVENKSKIEKELITFRKRVWYLSVKLSFLVLLGFDPLRTFILIELKNKLFKWIKANKEQEKKVS